MGIFRLLTPACKSPTRQPEPSGCPLLAACKSMRGRMEPSGTRKAMLCRAPDSPAQASRLARDLAAELIAEVPSACFSPWRTLRKTTRR